MSRVRVVVSLGYVVPLLVAAGILLAAGDVVIGLALLVIEAAMVTAITLIRRSGPATLGGAPAPSGGAGVADQPFVPRLLRDSNPRPTAIGRTALAMTAVLALLVVLAALAAGH